MSEGQAADMPALGGVSRLVLDLAPELGRWVFGPGAADTLRSVRLAVAAATGTEDGPAQVQALSEPGRAAALRTELARIAAGCEAAEAAALHAALARLAGQGRAAPGGLGASMAWGVPVVSLVVLVTFGAVAWIALTRSMPAGSEAVLNVLLGTLGAMATSVVGYWVGSSAGSARKDERLANLADRS